LIVQNFIGLLVSLSILIWSCDYAIKNSIAISNVFKIREIFVGIFIISIGTSLPEFAATFQALKLNSEGIVAGNLVGSNIANILLVGGIMVFPITHLNLGKEDKSTFRFFLIFSFLFFLLIIFNLNIDLKLGFILIFLLILFFYFELKKPSSEEVLEKNIKDQSTYILVFKIISAFIALFISSRYFIDYAKNLTEVFGVAETAIGITVVAFGTSLPEVVATVISIVKKQNNLAIGNILGSNIANILGITLIAIFVNGDINYYSLLTNIDKWLFLITSIIFFIIIYLRLAGKLISIGLILSYLAYFTYQYI
jgi:cation:H+ antiporter|tara:strand:- start:931 stop:1860 length:930 start_codon:yes stop_codon:yes gene_type:complete